jgi:hypothetical protein
VPSGRGEKDGKERKNKGEEEAWEKTTKIIEIS